MKTYGQLNEEDLRDLGIVTWQQIEQLNLSYVTLSEIIAELVNRDLSIDDLRKKILDGDLD